MKFPALPTLLLATLALAACGGDPPPPAQTASTEPAKAAAPATAAEAPPAAPAIVPSPQPVAPADAAAQNQPQESFVTKAASAAIPADAIGGSPVTNQADAWVRGNEALKKYCADTALPCDSFYVKESPQETAGYYTMQFFGAPNGEGMYIGVRIFPDGRAEVIR
jgi:hypothetical protein